MHHSEIAIFVERLGLRHIVGVHRFGENPKVVVLEGDFDKPLPFLQFDGLRTAKVTSDKILA